MFVSALQYVPFHICNSHIPIYIFSIKSINPIIRKDALHTLATDTLNIQCFQMPKSWLRATLI